MRRSAYRDKMGTVLLCGRVLLEEMVQDSDTPPRARTLLLDEALPEQLLEELPADRVVRTCPLSCLVRRTARAVSNTGRTAGLPRMAATTAHTCFVSTGAALGACLSRTYLWPAGASMVRECVEYAWSVRREDGPTSSPTSSGYT